MLIIMFTGCQTYDGMFHGGTVKLTKKAKIACLTLISADGVLASVLKDLLKSIQLGLSLQCHCQPVVVHFNDFVHSINKHLFILPFHFEHYYYP